MTKYRVTVDYTSKLIVDVDAESPTEAATQAMRQLKAGDPEAGPVGYVVTDNGAVVADQRAWRAKKKR